MEEITVKKLIKMCQDQIKKGNGDKVILLSSDDEGNEFHTMYYGFTDDKKELQSLAKYGMFHDHNDPDEVVILG